MAQYRVLEKSFIGNQIVEAGETIEYDGEASDNLELVSTKAKKGKSEQSADTGESGLV